MPILNRLAPLGRALTLRNLALAWAGIATLGAAGAAALQFTAAPASPPPALVAAAAPPAPAAGAPPVAAPMAVSAPTQQAALAAPDRPHPALRPAEPLPVPPIPPAPRSYARATPRYGATATVYVAEPGPYAAWEWQPAPDYPRYRGRYAEGRAWPGPGYYGWSPYR